MKKKILGISLVAMMALGLAGCGNKQIFDLAYTFNYAVIGLPNGESIEGEIDSWKDYEGEQLQVVIDGVTYLTHAENVVMMKR